MLTLSAPRTSWGSSGSFTMWKSSYRSSICGQGIGQMVVVRGLQGRDRMWVNGRDQAGDLPGSGENVGQGLHMPIVGSETSEVRDHWAGLPPSWGQRYPGQASYCLQEPELG